MGKDAFRGEEQAGYRQQQCKEDAPAGLFDGPGPGETGLGLIWRPVAGAGMNRRLNLLNACSNTLTHHANPHVGNQLLRGDIRTHGIGLTKEHATETKTGLEQNRGSILEMLLPRTKYSSARIRVGCRGRRQRVIAVTENTTTPMQSERTNYRLSIAVGPRASCGYLTLWPFTPFFPFVAKDLNTSVALLGQVSGLVAFASIPVGMITGPLADRYGHRKVLLTGMSTLGVGSLIPQSLRAMES